MTDVLMPDTRAIEPEVNQLIQVTQAIQVVTHEDYMSAGEHLKVVKRAQKQVFELFKEPKDMAFRAHKAITEAERKLLDPLKRAEMACNSKVTIYLQDLKRKEAEEAARVRREAEQKAAEDAKAQRKAQDDEKLRVAEQLKAQGFDEEADNIMGTETPIAPPAPVYIAPVPVAPKVEGVHLRTTYKAQVENLMLLVQEVAAGRQPVSLLLPNESALNKLATALKNELRIPGVRVIEQASTVTREGRFS